MRWPHFDELDDAQVTQAYEYVTQLIRERHPEADAQRGLLGTFVSELHAILQASVRDVLRQMHNSLSIKEVITNPAGANTVLVDKLIGNVGAARGRVTKAKGRIRILLHRPTRVTVAAGEIFIAADGQIFCADNTTIFKEPGVPLRGYDEVHMQPLEDRFAYAVAVTARDSGGKPPRHNSAFRPHYAPPGFDCAYAELDFNGSYVLQDDADAVRCIRLGLTAPGWSSRDSIEAMIRKADPEQYRFAADITDIVITGAPGKIRIGIRSRAGADVAALVTTLLAYLSEPCRACLSADVTVEALDAA